MKKKVVSIVLGFMLPLLSCYSQSTNKKDSNANSAAVENFIGKLMSNKQDTSKKVEGNHANSAALENNIARNNANSKGKAYLPCPDNNHPHQIDLGLPSGTKWACCNVGASTPEGYGGHYAWGETKEKKVYDWNTYIHWDGSKKTFHNLGRDIAGTKYDVAHVKWGGGWHMPTLAQIKELLDNTTSEWTSEKGVAGRKFTGSNGGTIFLPAAGKRWGSGLGSAGYSGDYWSSTLNEGNENYACHLYFFDVGAAHWDFSNRGNGQSVRPVR